MASKMRGPSAGRGHDASKLTKARSAYDLADSPSLRVVKKLCNRGLVSSQYLQSFKEKFGAIKAVINSKAVHAVDDEDYWLGKLTNQINRMTLSSFNPPSSYLYKDYILAFALSARMLTFC